MYKQKNGDTSDQFVYADYEVRIINESLMLLSFIFLLPSIIMSMTSFRDFGNNNDDNNTHYLKYIKII